MRFVKTTLLILAVVFSFVVFAVPRASAFNAFEKTCDGSVEANQSAVCQENGKADPNANTTADIINKVANIMAVVAGIMAVIYIMISGLIFMTSTGDSAKLQKARESIIYAAVGIVVIVLARLIIAFILKFV